MTLTYKYGDKLYLNITNRCSCACVFCVRQEYDGVGDGDNLWLEREPTADEVIADLETRTLGDYREVVFCGYGEPTERLDVMLELCRYLKRTAPETPVRLNTNGLSDIINGVETAPMLEGLVDIVSISLNAPDAASYNDVTRPACGVKAFDALLKFAEACKRYVPRVAFSLVDVFEEDEVERSQILADRMGIPLRVRVKA